MWTAGLGTCYRYPHSRMGNLCVGNTGQNSSISPLGPKHQGLHPAWAWGANSSVIFPIHLSPAYEPVQAGPQSLWEEEKGLYTFTALRDPQGPLKLLLLLVEKKTLCIFFIQQEKKCKRANNSGRWVEVLADSYFTEQFKIIYNIRKQWPSPIFIYFVINWGQF